MRKLIEILEELHPEVDFLMEEGLMDDRILDSFDMVSVISEIKEEFDVVITADEITSENFNSVHAIYELIKKKTDDEE